MYQEILFCHEQNIERMSANLNPFSRDLVHCNRKYRENAFVSLLEKIK